MAVTSSTTAVAFLANAFSDIMPLKAVTIYAAVIICVNYVQVVLFMPATLMFYKFYLQPLNPFECCCVWKDDLDVHDSDDEDLDR